jgi:ATP-dependent RNA circularization protein (DNA/RNA ligase family)
MYELQNWRGLKIAPYTCYELTSITDRSIFKDEEPNVIAAIVYNRDVEYFSNIIESLSRDLNCFVIQANDAQYGDSRIFQPAKKHHKNVLRFSGGLNHTALVARLDVIGLKEHLKRPLLVQMKNEKWKMKSPKSST